VLVLDMIEILPPLGKYKYDTWRILLVKCNIDNFVHLCSCIRNANSCGARRRPARCMQQRLGQLTGVEPSTRSNGSLTTRSSPMRTTRNGGSHRGPCGYSQGRVRAGDEEADTTKIGKVTGSMWCTSGFSSPLPQQPIGPG
jgi:hypothetical protein